MKQTILKFILPWITVIALFVSGFYLSTQHEKPITNHMTTAFNDTVNKSQINDKDISVRKKLINDFEIAFLKQYTPLLGCKVLDNEVKSGKCGRHLEQAKNDFKQQFIKNRGLPKNTFEELKLSFLEQ
ncbi:MAG: hypothetical protein AB8B92_09175 [Gammaproteobacteria bacterium]